MVRTSLRRLNNSWLVIGQREGGGKLGSQSVITTLEELKSLLNWPEESMLTVGDMFAVLYQECGVEA